MLTLEDYEEWRERLANALGCGVAPVDIAAAIGTLRAKAGERDEMAERVARDVQFVAATLPTAGDMDDLRRGLANPKRPVEPRLDEIRTTLAALRRYVEGIE